MIRFILLGFVALVSAQLYQPLQDLPYYYPNENEEMFQGLEELRLRELQAEMEDQSVNEAELRLPGALPKTNDSYLCTSFEQFTEKSILAFEPLDSGHAAHHIILFVCENPGSDAPIWDCGEMSAEQAGVRTQYRKAPPCQASSAPIYAWSHGAGDEITKLPKDVGYPIGQEAKNQFVVLQVHYMNTLEKEDFSGVKIQYTNQPQPKTAATLLLVTGGLMPKQQRTQMEAACVVDEDVELHPISFRVHTHRHGESVSGWIVNENEQGQDEWTQIGERSPQKPQIFEPVKNTSLIIKQGDILTARCTINNNENHPIEVGPTGEDEMCNYYIQYWTDGKPLSDNVCYSPGPPNYRWSKEAGLNHIPK